MNVSRQIGWSNESNLLYQILKQITKLTAVVFGLKPKYKVYTALLTQSGGDDPIDVNTGLLNVGVTYYISNESIGMDFTNVGAPNNNILTFFVATGTTPNSWGESEGLIGILQYNTGAPVAIVLQNTIGNIWFTYESVGTYPCVSDNLFIEDKTAIDIDTTGQNGAVAAAFISNETLFPINMFRIFSWAGNTTGDDDVLMKNRIEIRVYS
jgi:hypothetical protein